VVLTVWEPVRVWEPYDPASVLSAPLARLASQELGLDETAEDLAREKTERGVALARDAGFVATGRVSRGKIWRTICQVAEELDAEPIVVGARGLARVEAAPEHRLAAMPRASAADCGRKGGATSRRLSHSNDR
jgi:nucleotide-binding universal stress UspA family protein